MTIEQFEELLEAHDLFHFNFFTETDAWSVSSRNTETRTIHLESCFGNKFTQIDNTNYHKFGTPNDISGEAKLVLYRSGLAVEELRNQLRRC